MTNETRSATDQLDAARHRSVTTGTVNMMPFYAARAEGAVIIDVEGREILDFAGGIGVLNLGHCHPKVVAAVKDQAEKLLHTCYMVVPYAPYVELADRLTEIAPIDGPAKAVFVNSGAEAVENAIKVARYATGRPAVIALEHGFHGRTFMGMSLTSKIKPYKHGFGPMVGDTFRMPAAYCYRCPFNDSYPGCDVRCAEYLHTMFTSYVEAEQVAAVIAEPVIGEGGFMTPPPEYFPRLKAICEEHGILFISDEIQAGMGRTGTWFAIEHWGVKPDLVTVAKSLASGMPLAGVIGRAELMDAVHPGGLGGTYGGNPVACQAALATLDAIEEEDIFARATALGDTLRARMEAWRKEFELIGDVRGKGAMLAMELVRDRATKEPADTEARALAAYARDHGLVLLSCGTYGNVIRFLMPLVITDEQLERGLAIVEGGLRQVTG